VPFTYFKLNPPSAFVYFRWSRSWSCYFGLGLKNVILFTLLYLPQLNIIVHLLVTELMLASEGDMCVCVLVTARPVWMCEWLLCRAG